MKKTLVFGVGLCYAIDSSQSGTSPWDWTHNKITKEVKEMKKKILSTLLAACLFVGIAIPSVMAATSDVAGDAKKVSKITMIDEKDAYDITVGNEGFDFEEKIAVYEDNTKLVLDHNHIRYMLKGNVGSNNTGDFEIIGSKVWAKKAGATATLTIFDSFNASSKARLTIKLTGVAPTTSFTEYAESFTFKSNSFDVPFDSGLGNAENVALSVQAHPSGTKFNTADNAYLAAIESTKLAIAKALNLKAGAGSTIAGTLTTEGKAGVPAGTAVEAKIEFSIDLGQTVTVAATTTAGTANLKFTTTAFGGSTFVSEDADVADATTYTSDVFAALFDGKTVTIEGKVWTIAAANHNITMTAPAGTKIPEGLALVSGVSLTGVAGLLPTMITTSPATLTQYVDADTAVDGVKGVYTLDLSSVVLPDAGTSITVLGTTINVMKADVKDMATFVTAVKTALATANGGFDTAVTGNVITLTQSTAGTGTIADLTTTLTTAGSSAAYDTSKITVTLGETVVPGDTAVFTVDESVLTAAKKNELAGSNRANYVSVNTGKLPKFQLGSGVVSNGQSFTASTNLNLIDAIRAQSVRVSDIDVVVGKKVEPTITYEPANANVGKAVTMSIRSDKNDGKPWQFAVIDDGKVLGVNSAGITRLEVALTGTTQNPGNNNNWATYAKVTVKPTDFNSDKPYTSKISATTIETKVGQVTPLNITGMPSGVTVEWVYNNNGVMDLTNNNKASNAIIAKKVGTTNVVAKLSNGESFKVAVTVAAADAKAPETDVPQTGDSFLKF